MLGHLGTKMRDTAFQWLGNWKHPLGIYFVDTLRKNSGHHSLFRPQLFVLPPTRRFRVPSPGYSFGSLGRRILPRPLGVSDDSWTIVRNCGPNSMWILKQKGPPGLSFPAILNVFWHSRGAGVLQYSITIRWHPCAVPRACSCTNF